MYFGLHKIKKKDIHYPISTKAIPQWDVWMLVGVSWQRSTGRGVLFVNDQKVDVVGLLPAGTKSNTKGNIRMGSGASSSQQYGWVIVTYTTSQFDED